MFAKNKNEVFEIQIAGGETCVENAS